MSCIWIDLEKQIVLRINRLIWVQKYFILAPPKDIGQGLPAVMIVRDHRGVGRECRDFQ